jgi:formylglycine-generating enzyme required for sulfatase activity
MDCSVGDSECVSDENPPHEVHISKGFWLGQTQVTQAAWKKVMKGNPSNFKGDELPVERVTWQDAVKYCETIGGRPPTEAEWEYAARAGSTAARYGDLEAIAWYDENQGGTTHAVGGKQANEYGLFDMLGNVGEWVQDDYAPYEPEAATGPVVVIKDSKWKVVRGGCWFYVPQYARASDRNWLVPVNRNVFIGFGVRGIPLGNLAF